MKSKRFKILILGSSLALLSLLALGVILDSVAARAKAAQTSSLLWLNPIEAVAVTGGSTNVDIELSDISNVYGIEVNLEFNPTILSVVGGVLTPGTCPAPDFVLANSADNVSGTIEYAATQLLPTEPCNGGVVASIEFACAEGLLSEVTTPVTITSSLISDPGGLPVAHSTQNGAVRCEANIFFIEGIVSLQTWPNPAGVQVDLVDATGATVGTEIVGADGAFGFTGTTGETYSVEASYDRYLALEASGITSSIVGDHVDIGQGILRAGDINGDDIINILDISAVAGNYQKSSPQPWVP